MGKSQKITDEGYESFIETPVGTLRISSSDEAITSISYSDSNADKDSSCPKVINQCKKQLNEYFSGKRDKFDFPISVNGTEFQKKVWNALTEIPPGKLVSYKDIAESIGNPKAVRAVGNANNKNPISIVVPCHRVVGSDGKMVGYAGGLWRKEWLIKHEKPAL